LRRLLRHSLAEAPRKRLRDIGDARLELDAIHDTKLDQAPPATVRTMAAGWLLPVAVVALVVLLALWKGTRITSQQNPLEGGVSGFLTDWEGTEESAEISPDGTLVTFISDRDGEFDLWSIDLSTRESRNLTSGIRPFDLPGILRTSGFSGDGQRLWYGVLQKPTMIMPRSGGTPQPFLEQDARTPSWSYRGDRLVYFKPTHEDGDLLFTADASGNGARTLPVTWPSSEERKLHNHNPVWSVDDQWIYFVHGFVREWNQRDDMDIWRVRSSGGAAERLTTLQTTVTFLAAIDAASMLYVARAEDGSGPWLWALDFRSRMTQRVSSGLEQYTSVSASRDGLRLAATRARPTTSLWRVPIVDGVSDETAADRYPLAGAPAASPRFGGQSLFYVTAPGTGDALRVFRNGNASDVSTRTALSEAAAPSRDGRWVAVSRKRDGKNRLVIMAADGSQSQTIARSLDVLGSADWSPDDHWIVTGGSDANGPGLFKVPLDGGTPIVLVRGQATNPVWSPIDHIIIYEGRFASGQTPLFGVKPDGTPSPIPALRVRPGGYRFLRDGSGLVYLPRPESLDFWLLDLATGKSRQLTRLVHHGAIRAFDISPDGRHIVFDRTKQNGDVVLIERTQ